MANLLLILPHQNLIRLLASFEVVNRRRVCVHDRWNRVRTDGVFLLSAGLVGYRDAEQPFRAAPACLR